MRRTIVVVAATLVASVLAAFSEASRPAAAAPQGRWLAGDLHVHTTYSHDSYGGPADDNTGPDEAYTLGWSVGEQSSLARSRGLDFMAITDHNDVRSQSDPAWGSDGLIWVPGYENSLPGHAQMLGATQVADNGAASLDDVRRLAAELRAQGGAFQINHPSDRDWIDNYGMDFVPDSIEVWNIGAWAWQPPFPAANDNDFSLRFYDSFLDAGHRVAVTGGSDSHWRSLSAAAGVGQPTTYVFSETEDAAGVLAGIRAGRTSIGMQPPAYGGTFAKLEADADGDGEFESMSGDSVPAGSAARAVVRNATGAKLRLVTDGSTTLEEVPITSPQFEHTFEMPAGSTWVRAEIFTEDAAVARSLLGPVCGAVGATLCDNRLTMLALTSPVYATATTAPSDAHQWHARDVYARATEDEIVVGNRFVERRWSRESFATTSLTDRRSGTSWSEGGSDFSLSIAEAADIPSESFTATDVEVTRLRRGLRVEIDLTGPGIQATRTVEIFDDVAGMATQTSITPAVPLALRGATLERATVGDGAASTIHGFRAGADWREPDWDGPGLSVGDPHAGTWRATRSGEPGEQLEGPAQWLSVERAAERLFMVVERNDQPSTRAGYDGESASAEVDYSRDVVGLGPFEEEAHTENPGVPAGRVRSIGPGRTLALEPVFVGLAQDAGDEPWQWHKYLSRHRLEPYEPDLTFNSNGTDTDRISTGAKDDMDYDTILEVAPIARAMGVDTFILDDGWQAISGDWEPDSPQHPEPRWDSSPDSKFAPRFPDDSFKAVRKAIAPMKLGLWMSPMHFNPSSETYRRHPEWACVPLGHGLAAVNALQPDEGSNEAGIGTWGPDAIPHVESRLRDAIENWKVRYFKFDFLVWLDCAGQGDLYDYREAFVGMVDRLQADYPRVTFQIDETNDYRLFPFESVTRGPSWFQNGSPEPRRLLHNLWNLSPYVPAYSLGQHLLGGRQWDRYPTDTLMAAALPSHQTFFSDLRAVPQDVVDRARVWSDFHERHADSFTQMTYPLLDDPIEGGWTGLQSWNPEAARGAVLVFRQDSPQPSTEVALRDVPPGRSFDLVEAPTGERVGTVTSEDLAQGLEVTLEPNGARVLLIEPAD